jgi:hypothetical protein
MSSFSLVNKPGTRKTGALDFGKKTKVKFLLPTNERESRGMKGNPSRKRSKSNFSKYTSALLLDDDSSQSPLMRDLSKNSSSSKCGELITDQSVSIAANSFKSDY